MSALRTILAPRMWGAHLLMVVVVGAAASLGVWQFTVSERAKEAQVNQLAHTEPKPLTEAMGPNDAMPAAYLGRPVTAEGRWLADGSVVVANQRQDDRDGYWVVSPLQVDGTESAIYVVRGWTASADDVPAAPTGPATVVGWLQPPQQDAVTDDDSSDDVVPQLDTVELLDRVDVDLYSAYLVSAFGEGAWAQKHGTTNVGSDELEPVAAPQPPEPDSSEGLRNLLYAIEWWLFAAFGLYIWGRYLHDVTRPAPEDPDDDHAEKGTQEASVGSAT